MHRTTWQNIATHSKTYQRHSKRRKSIGKHKKSIRNHKTLAKNMQNYITATVDDGSREHDPTTQAPTKHTKHTRELKTTT